MVFRDIHHLRSMRFEKADYVACDILLDLQTAVKRARLTRRQAQAIEYIYELGFTQKEVAEILDIPQKVVSVHLNTALNKVANVFRDWEYGEVLLTLEEEPVNEVY